MTRPFNFYAGPSVLAPEVLEATASAIVGLAGVGLSVMEISHRSPPFEEILFDARQRLRSLLNVPDTHEILFLQGGARGQFAQLPMNFVNAGEKIGVVDTGVWSKGVLAEACSLWGGYSLASSESTNYDRLPDLTGVEVEAGTSYVHTTSNNTIYGTQFHALPTFGPSVRHVCDMSSDILSRPIDVGSFGCIYAGAQKNAGPSGVTIVILDRAWMAAGREDIPAIWQYRVQAKKDSMYNTPPTLAIYCVGQVARWLQAQGGVDAIQRQNAKKAALVWDAIDASDGFYQHVVAVAEHRSHMNVTFRTPSAELDKRFVAEAASAEMLGLKGHRLAGGLRASMYNQLPVAAAERLATFMDAFRRKA